MRFLKKGGNKMSYFKFQNSKIHYEVYGKGRPLLYVHGWNSSYDNFKQNLLGDLKNKYMVILLDLPGYGKSERTGISFENFSSIIDKLLGVLKIKKINLVGSCMGSAIGLDYAIKNPQRIDKLIVIETYIKFPLILHFLRIKKTKSFLFNFFVFNKVGSFVTKKYLLLDNFKYRENFFESFQKNDKKTSLEYLNLLWQYSKIDHYKRMESLDRKVYILVGDKTRGAIIRTAEKIRQSIKKSDLIFVENSGHFPIEENSKEIIRIIESSFV